MFEVRPHGFGSQLGVLCADTYAQAVNLHRIFGGVIVYMVTGWDVTP